VKEFWKDLTLADLNQYSGVAFYVANLGLLAWLLTEDGRWLIGMPWAVATLVLTAGSMSALLLTAGSIRRLQQIARVFFVMLHWRSERNMQRAKKSRRHGLHSTLLDSMLGRHVVPATPRDRLRAKMAEARHTTVEAAGVLKAINRGMREGKKGVSSAVGEASKSMDPADLVVSHGHSALFGKLKNHHVTYAWQGCEALLLLARIVLHIVYTAYTDRKACFFDHPDPTQCDEWDHGGVPLWIYALESMLLWHSVILQLVHNLVKHDEALQHTLVSLEPIRAIIVMPVAQLIYREARASAPAQ